MTSAWIDLPSHRRWLAGHFGQLLAFGRRTAYPGGGAAWLDDTGAPWLEQGVHTWITCRTAHVYSLGALLGIPGSRPIAQAAVDGLTGTLRDAASGGWFTQRNADGSTPDEKAAYSHAFVMLAASSATVAGLSGAASLLTEATGVFLQRFWDEDAGRVVDSWDRTFTSLDSYRGLNANMHTVEAFLAVADVTGERVWLEREERRRQ